MCTRAARRDALFTYLPLAVHRDAMLCLFYFIANEESKEKATTQDTCLGIAAKGVACVLLTILLLALRPCMRSMHAWALAWSIAILVR